MPISRRMARRIMYGHIREYYAATKKDGLELWHITGGISGGTVHFLWRKASCRKVCMISLLNNI